MSGWEINERWLAFTSIVLAPILLAMGKQPMDQHHVSGGRNGFGAGRAAEGRRERQRQEEWKPDGG